MFHIFFKKRFLVDSLTGLVDIHNHILPGIDDGAKTPADSLKLIKGFKEFGINRFIVTPHIMHNYYPNTPETINSSLTVLQNTLLKSNITDVTIVASAEHMIDDNYENLLEEGGIMPLDKDHVLVEMSYLQESINLRSALEKTKQNGYFPVMAHPERYLYYKNNVSVYRTLKENGIKFQLNLLSLGHYYGLETHKLAHDMLAKGLIDYTATDAHHVNHLKELKKIEIKQNTLNKLFPVLENTITQFY